MPGHRPIVWPQPGAPRIETASTMPPRPWPFAVARRERRMLRRGRRWKISSLRSTPRACTNKLR